MAAVVSMRFRSNKSEDELTQLSHAGLEKFRALPGLSQKYYVKDPSTGLVGGIYIFHTRQAADDYVNGPIVGSVRERYGIEGELAVEVLDVQMTLSE
ncbi:YdhR family protein [Tomitella cavernea]|uniref:Monooxygenase n=1 Tax=Tomitella cavernea TaxID=1387982 RepID=A0ABP9CNM5_9ACTN|nr:YdhR family protein [Tomitella cavernea]